MTDINSSNKTSNEPFGDNVADSVGMTEAVGGYSAKEAFEALCKVVTSNALRTESSTLVGELGRIALGRSELELPTKDWRFKDNSWHQNALFKRLGQSYLATSKAINNLIPENADWEDRERAKFAANVLTSSIAPSNWLVSNPAALKEIMETGGSSAFDGIKNMVDDLLNNGGMPKQVDASDFRVGENLAVSPGAVVYRHEMFELIQYQPTTATVNAIPVMLIPPQIGKYYFTDLAPGRSFVEHAVANGLPYFTVSWRNPGKEHRGWTLEKYIAALIEAVDAVCDITGQDKINFVGFCAGGITTSILLSYFTAIGRDCINTATFCVTLLDFKSESSVGSLRLPALLKMAKKNSQRKGIIAGQELSKLFAWLRPNDLIWNYWFNNYLMGKQPPSFDILAWNADSTNMTAGLHNDFLCIFEDSSKLVTGGLNILGQPVNISAIDCDKFVLGALTDHLTPWKGCYHTTQLLRGKSTFALSNAGHVAALVNPPGNTKARYWLAENKVTDADEWLETATEHQGSWWDAWVQWTKARGGKEKAAPKELGNQNYPVLCEAPGTYIYEVPNS